MNNTDNSTSPTAITPTASPATSTASSTLQEADTYTPGEEGSSNPTNVTGTTTSGSQQNWWSQS